MASIVPNALLVARREYLQRVRSRAFVISTVILGLVAFAAGLAPAVIRVLDQDSTATIAIHVSAPDLEIDPVVQANVVLNAGALQAGDLGRRAFDVVLATDLERARDDVRAGRLAGVLDIGRGPGGLLSYEYVAPISPGGRMATIMQLTAVWLSIQDGLERSGRGATSGQGPYEAFRVTPPDASTPSAPTEAQSVSDIIVATVLIILVFITVMTYGMWVAVSVVEEKSSRVMELMLAAATPTQMLAGKIVGMGLAGLTQYAAIVGLALVAILVQGPAERLLLGGRAAGVAALSGLTPQILVGFVVFFALGFVLYAVLYAAAGSLVSRQEDVQLVAMPMIVLAMAGYFAASFAVQSIESGWVAPVSLIPFFSPYLMVARLVLGRVEVWEVALAIAILVLTIGAATLLAARVYRAGVLLYGQRPGLRAFVAAVRLAR